MTPDEHRAEAERLLLLALKSTTVAAHDRNVRLAHVHALLALTPPAPHYSGY